MMSVLYMPLGYWKNSVQVTSNNICALAKGTNYFPNRFNDALYDHSGVGGVFRHHYTNYYT